MTECLLFSFIFQKDAILYFRHINLLFNEQIALNSRCVNFLCVCLQSIKFDGKLTSYICRLLPLYFPRDKQEEEIAIAKLPADVGDENGETVIDERKIRIKPLPKTKKSSAKEPQATLDLSSGDAGLTRRSVGITLYNQSFACEL